MNEMYDQGVVGLNLASSKDLFHIRTAPLVYLPMVVKLQVISSYVRSTTINIQHSIYKPHRASARGWLEVSDAVLQLLAFGVPSGGLGSEGAGIVFRKGAGDS